MRKVFADFECDLREFDGEHGHVHPRVSLPPKAALSRLVNSLNGASSRRLRTDLPPLQRHFRHGALWSPSKFAASCGRAPRAKLKAYLRQQARPGEAPHRPGLPSFRGLGPRSRVWLAGIGIDTPEQLAAQDPFEVHRRLKAAQPAVGLNLLYALIGAIEDRDWREEARRERTPVLWRLEEVGLG